MAGPMALSAPSERLSTASSSQGRSPATIRYSDVAHYVGLSLTRSPAHTRSGPKAQQLVQSLTGRRPHTAPVPQPETPVEVLSQERSQLHSMFQANRSERLRCQLEWLRAEHRAEKEALHRLEGSLSDSLLLERKAQKKVAKSRIVRDFHQQKIDDVEHQIAILRGELHVQNAVAAAPRSLASRGSPQLSPKDHRLGAVQASSSRATDLEGTDRTIGKPEEDSEAEESDESGLTADDEDEDDEVAQEELLNMRAARRSDREVLEGRNSVPLGRPRTSGHAVADARPFTSSGHAGADARYSGVDIRPFTSGEARNSDLGGLPSVGLRRRTARASLDEDDFNQAPTTTTTTSDTQPSLTRKRSTLKERTSLAPPPQAGPSWASTYVNFKAAAANRSAKWQPHNPEEKIQVLLDAQHLGSEGVAKKRWMSSTFRRLKTRGKSDARCREVVALHLPRGTGPRDREDVPIFSENEVRACRKSYTDSYMDPVKRIQKVLVDMKDQKRELRAVREDLFMVTEARILQQRAEEDRKNVVASIGGLSLMGKVKDPLAGEDVVETHRPKQPLKPLGQLSQECGMDEAALGALFKDYSRFADANQSLGRKAFAKLMQVLCPTLSAADANLDSLWAEITHSGEGSSNGRRAQFEEFAAWYAKSDVRKH